MKSCALLLLTAGLACPAEFTTGQAARLVIGQQTFTRQQSGASEVLLGGVSGLAYSNGMLMVVDSNRLQATPLNHRVLIYKSLPSIVTSPLAEIPADGSRCPVCTGVADVVLGQPDFSKTELSLSQNGMRNPTAVATDGRVVAVADTDNNRVLIWNSIPTGNAQLASVVIGQPDFKSSQLNWGGAGNTPSQKGLRGPQGVWIQDGKFFVADTQNNRILIWNRIPTENGQAADVVLGQPNFTTFVQPDLTQTAVDARPGNLLTPVSVTSDGIRLYVADLGHNRILVWNSMPASNGAAADFALGQPDIASSKDVPAQNANNSKFLCAATGKNDKNEDTFPLRCASTVDTPRFALSDGKRLFVADGGNDRVLVYLSIPTRNGQRPDVILGQPDEFSAVYTDLRTSSADSIRTPMSLALDGTNLYVSDPFNRRVLVFTAGEDRVPQTGVRNAASQEVFAVGVITLAGKVKENDETTVKIGSKEYKYKAVKDDTFARVINGLVAQINAGAGDPLAFASPNVNFQTIILTSRTAGDKGNETEYSATVSANAEVQVTTSGARLSGGQDAAQIAPGTVVSVLGQNLTSVTASAPASDEVLPRTLGGVQVYMDGIPAPLLFVSPTQINAQVPFEVSDASSVSAYVRTTRPDGSATISNAIAMPVIPQNPGIFAAAGADPRPAVATHGSSFATGVISVDGSIKVGDIATVKIEDREYRYTVVAGDNLESVRDRLIELINEDEKVIATAAGQFTRIRLRAKTPGKDSEGLSYSASANDGASLILTAFTQGLCCANTQGAPITVQNPAVPGEVIIVYATGLGLILPNEAKDAAQTGVRYRGPQENRPNAPLDSLAGGKTANVLYAGYKQGDVGVYEIHLQLNADIPTNEQTQLTIAQDIYISNIVTFAVFNPNAEPQP